MKPWWNHEIQQIFVICHWVRSIKAHETLWTMVNFIQKPSMSDWVGCWQSKAGKLLTHRGWNTNRYRYLRLIWNDILTNIFIWYKLTKLVDGCWRWSFHWQVWFPKCLVDCSFAIIFFHWFFLTCTFTAILCVKYDVIWIYVGCTRVW